MHAWFQQWQGVNIVFRLAVCAFSLALMVIAAPVATLAQEDTAREALTACVDCPELVPLAGGAEIGKYLVTVDQFAAFVKATNYETDDACTQIAKTPIEHFGNWRDPGFPQKGNYPVVCVSWIDATAYVDWLSETTGEPYRLPTVEESQEAAAGGATTKFFWGDDVGAVCQHANVADAKFKAAFPNDPRQILTCDDGYTYTSPVDAFPPNGLGVYDGIGNAWQWTNSCLNGDCANAIFRGASWTVPNPKFFALDGTFGDRILLRNTAIGFRVLRD